MIDMMVVREVVVVEMLNVQVGCPERKSLYDLLNVSDQHG